jgi:hypothetical protein
VIFYVYSGSLQGECVYADDAWTAVEHAVRQQIQRNEYCVLGPLTRVCYEVKDGSRGENIITPPYEDHFPALFEDEDIAFEVATVE